MLIAIVICEEQIYTETGIRSVKTSKHISMKSLYFVKMNIRINY